MSVRDLEDFIRIIETAEKISRTESSRTQKTSTDIFTTGIKNVSIDRNKVSVPKLWNPKSGSDFLGSSWGSDSKTKVDTVSSGYVKNSATNLITRSSTDSSSVITAKERTPTSKTSNNKSVNSDNNNISSPIKSSSSSFGSPLKSSLKNSPFSSSSNEPRINPLIQMQQNSGFARTTAKELFPSLTPESSPNLKRKSLSSRSSNQTQRKSVSSSPKKSGSSSEKTKGKEYSSSFVLSNSSPSKSSSTDQEILEVIEMERDLSPDSPRIPPAPNTLMPNKVIIRQNSVSTHDHTIPLTKSKSTKLQNNKKVRPRSAPGIKRNKVKIKPEEESQVDLRNYSKSLKLLGLDIPSNRREATKLTHYDVEIKTKSPRIRTRLKERTQSVSELQEIIDSKEKISKKEYEDIKIALSRAVFEEWYFKKAAIEQEKKRKSDKNEDEYAEDKKQLREENYKKWLKEKKEAELKKRKEMEEKNKAQDNEQDEKKKMKIKEAEEKWLKSKKKEYLRRKKLEMDKLNAQKEENLKLQLKKEEVEKHFLVWKENIDKSLKEKAMKEKEKKEKKKLKEKEDQIEKVEDAKAAFKAWLRKKKEEMMDNVQNENNPEEDENNTEKMEKAKEAYDNWLDNIEQREIIKDLIEEEMRQKVLWRPPWYPSGSHE